VSAAARSRARGAAVALLLASALLAGASAAAAVPGGQPISPANQPISPAKIRYARIRRVCPPARPGGATCFALVRVPVASNVAASVGAKPYTLDDGASESGPAGGLTPGQLASAYEYDSTEGGAGQTVAIVDAYDEPNIEADLGKFDENYKLAECTTANGCFKKVSQTGSTTELPAAEPGWGVEISLDVETVHSVCPKCKILLVEANEPSDVDLGEAVDEAVKLGATEVSNSYGGPEGAGEEAAYNHPGVMIAASAGDDGYYDWDVVSEGQTPPARPNTPASLPTVVAVGGTSLKLNENGTRAGETVWNDSGRPTALGEFDSTEFKQFSATGGGCSTLFAAPSWQLDTPGWTNTGCGSKRLDNDISAVADPYTGFDIYDVEEGGWLTIGGTSLSSPLVSSLYALAGGSGGVSYPAATLYSHLGQSSLFDVTEGGNGYCDGEAVGPCDEPAANETFGDVDCEGTTACDAASGYDGPSGVGAPKGLGEFKSKATSLVTQTTATLSARVNPDGQTITECKFEYGTSTAYGASASCKTLPGSGSSPVEVSAKVAALTPNTEYHFRVVTKSAAGTIDGPDVTFKTLKVAAPAVETKPASAVGQTTATLNASVNPRGGALSACKLEYGKTTAYGSSVACTTLPGSGSSPVPVSALVTMGLAANTEYHFRISATNTAGTSKGADVTFKTT
jgi:hypothetical protein